MAIPTLEKWIVDVSADDETTKVAAKSVESRLLAVLRCLPLATDESNANFDSVHQLRVWTRRANVALQLYQRWIPRQQWRWMKRQLKRVRRAANDARDCDVLLRRLSNSKDNKDATRWLESIRNQRIDAQGPIAHIRDRLSHRQRFKHRIDRLVKSMRSRGKKKSKLYHSRFREWASQRLQRFLSRFFKAVPAAPDDSVALHCFRLRVKELRYAIELLGGGFPDQVRYQLYGEISAIQDRLGQLNDLSTSAARLQDKLKSCHDTEEKESCRRLLTAELAQLEVMREEFWQWCSPEMLRILRTRFDLLLENDVQRVSLAR
jgi:CHAD domain-containing protein